MKRSKDYPKFMKWTHEIPVTKNGKERSQEDINREKNKIKSRIDEDIICPMNWLQDTLDRIQGSERKNIIDTSEFLCERPKGKPKATQMSKIREMVEEYDKFTKNYMLKVNDGTYSDLSLLYLKTEELLDKIRNIKMSNITIYRLIQTSLGIEGTTRKNYIYKDATKYTRKMMSVLYKTNKEKFLNCFKPVSL